MQIKDIGVRKEQMEDKMVGSVRVPWGGGGIQAWL